MKRLSPSRRREDIWSSWTTHIKAQQESRQSQVNYCCPWGLDPEDFTLWKRKLREPGVPAKPAAMVALRLSLGNGISWSLELADASIPTLVRELAALNVDRLDLFAVITATYFSA